MAHPRSCITCFLLLLLFFFTLAAHAASPRVVVGILPFYDSSAEAISDRLAPNLAYFLYQDLLKSMDIVPVLLSPGGLYDPESEELIENYAGLLKVDAVLIGRILPSIKVNDHSVKLNIEVQMVDLATGKQGPKLTNATVQLSRNDFFANVASTYVNSTYVDFYGNTKAFAKQPLGKATAKLAEWTADNLETTIQSMGTAGSGEEPKTAGGACEIGVRILYTARHAASKSYMLFANDEDQTDSAKEGTAHFSIPAGPLALRFQVNDAPYRFPTQKSYQISTSVDCSRPGQTLMIDLGTSGEARPHWE
jgi:hypothetical protein